MEDREKGAAETEAERDKELWKFYDKFYLEGKCGFH
jgi:hypothetical protein